MEEPKKVEQFNFHKYISEIYHKMAPKSIISWTPPVLPSADADSKTLQEGRCRGSSLRGEAPAVWCGKAGTRNQIHKHGHSNTKVVIYIGFAASCLVNSNFV